MQDNPRERSPSQPMAARRIAGTAGESFLARHRPRRIACFMWNGQTYRSSPMTFSCRPLAKLVGPSWGSERIARSASVQRSAPEKPSMRVAFAGYCSAIKRPAARHCLLSRSFSGTHDEELGGRTVGQLTIGGKSKSFGTRTKRAHPVVTNRYAVASVRRVPA